MATKEDIVPMLAILRGRRWDCPNADGEYLVEKTDGKQNASVEEADFLLFNVMNAMTRLEEFQHVTQSLTLRPVQRHAEEEKRDDVASDQVLRDDVASDQVLLDVSMEVPELTDPDVMYDIVDLPSNHILLKPGEIAKPLVQRAVKRHVSTLGLPFHDAAAYLPALLTSSSPLRYLRLHNKEDPHLFVSSSEIHQLLKALQGTSAPLIEGIVFTDLKLDFDSQLSQVLCSSLTYLGFYNCRYVGGPRRFLDALKKGLQGQLCKVKQFHPGWLKLLELDQHAVDCFRQILQRPNCTLTRLDLRDCSVSAFHFNSLLVYIMTHNKSLTDLGLPMRNTEEMQVFVDSRLHTRILTLRLDLWGMEEYLSNVLVPQVLLDPTSTIQFLDCYAIQELNITAMWHALTENNVSPAALRVLRIVSLLRASSSSAAGLAHYLCSPAASKLVYLEVRSHKGTTGLSQADADKWECANSLINNFSICTLVFPWQNRAAEAYAASLIRRNRLYRASQLLSEEPQVKPNVAKLFLCGHPETGKTTLCQALHLLRHPWPISSLGGSCGLNPRPGRTRGMEFHSLAFRRNYKKLLICDLAGQEEYHVFHHYFVNASNNDIFIIVCEVDSSSSLQEFELQLDYWLRFVVSHRSAHKKTMTISDVNHAESKPKVIVVVNFFEQGKPSDVIWEITRTWTSILMNKFSAVLDFAQVNGPHQNLFGVNARTALGVRHLKWRLESLLRDFDNAAWPIPKLCYDISAQLTKGSRTNWLCTCTFTTEESDSSLLTSYSAVLEMLSDKSHLGIDSTRVQAALQELHMQGYVVFFPSEEMQEAVGKSHSMKMDSVGEDKIMSTLVITDISWFCNKLVGSLLGTHLEGEPKRPIQWVWVKEDIKTMLRKQRCKEIHLEEILRYLEHLELCVSLDSVPDQQKGMLLFPALVKEKEIRYPSVCNGTDAMSATFFGRRFRCRDSSIHLIPFGVFTRLQVKLHKEYCANNKSFNIGYGWASFMRGNVGVVVRFGGDLINEAWESKQWIDILTFCPVTRRYIGSSSFLSTNNTEGHHTNPIDDSSLIAGNRLIDQIKTLIYATCKTSNFGGIPTVALEEWVLQSKEPNTDAVRLSWILEKLTREGLLGCHQEWKIHIGSTPVVNLLLPKEIEDHVKGQLNVLAAIEEEFSLSGQGAKEDQEQELEDEVSNGCGKQLTGELPYLLECIKSEVRSIEKRQQKMLEMIRVDILRLEEVMRQTERDIIANCSTRLLRNELRKDRAYPVYLYLVDVAGKLAPLKTLFGKRAVVHFMCESPTEGPHLVEGQKGKEVMMEMEGWAIKVARVLLPALRVICCLARVAASVYLPSAQVFVPSPEALVNGLGIESESLQHVILPEALKALLTQLPDVDHRQFLNNADGGCVLHKNEVKEVMQAILKNVEVNMAIDFGLYRVCFDDEVGHTFWVCDRHACKGKLLHPILNPYK